MHISRLKDARNFGLFTLIEKAWKLKPFFQGERTANSVGDLQSWEHGRSAVQNLFICHSENRRLVLKSEFNGVTVIEPVLR